MRFIQKSWKHLPGAWSALALGHWTARTLVKWTSLWKRGENPWHRLPLRATRIPLKSWEKSFLSSSLFTFKKTTSLLLECCNIHKLWLLCPRRFGHSKCLEYARDRVGYSSYACILRSYRPEYPVSMLAWDVQAGLPLSCYFWIFFKNWKWLLIGKQSRVWLFTSTACACNSLCQQRRNKCTKNGTFVPHLFKYADLSYCSV